MNTDSRFEAYLIRFLEEHIKTLPYRSFPWDPNWRLIQNEARNIRM